MSLESHQDSELRSIKHFLFCRFTFSQKLGISCQDINPVMIKCHYPEKLPGVTRDAERYLTSLLVDALSHNVCTITVPRYQGNKHIL